MSKIVMKNVTDDTVVANVDDTSCYLQIATLGDVLVKNVKVEMTKTELVTFAERIIEACK